MKGKTELEDWTKQALKIFSRKIEKELKEKSCGCTDCKCTKSRIGGVPEWKPNGVTMTPEQETKYVLSLPLSSEVLQRASKTLIKP